MKLMQISGRKSCGRRISRLATFVYANRESPIAGGYFNCKPRLFSQYFAHLANRFSLSASANRPGAKSNFGSASAIFNALIALSAQRFVIKT